MSNLLLSTSATSSTRAATHTASFAIFTQLLCISESLFSFGSSTEMIWCVSPAFIVKYSLNRKVMSHRTGKVKLERTLSDNWVKEEVKNWGTWNHNSGAKPTPWPILNPQRLFRRQKVFFTFFIFYCESPNDSLNINSCDHYCYYWHIFFNLYMHCVINLWKWPHGHLKYNWCMSLCYGNIEAKYFLIFFLLLTRKKMPTEI